MILPKHLCRIRPLSPRSGLITTRLSTKIVRKDRRAKFQVNVAYELCLGNEDSCRIQVPSKSHACPELYTAEVCNIPGTGCVCMAREKPTKTNCHFSMCNPNPDLGAAVWFTFPTKLFTIPSTTGSHFLPNCSHSLWR